MSLLDFLCKWDSTEERKLKSAVCIFFERDPRTLRNWMSDTPKYARFVLGIIDKHWEQSGFSLQVFFEM